MPTNTNTSCLASDSAKPAPSQTPPPPHPSSASSSVPTSSFPSKPLKRGHKTQTSFLPLTEAPSCSGRPTQQHNLPVVPCKKAKTGNSGLLRTSWQRPPPGGQVQRHATNSVDSSTVIAKRRVPPPKTRKHHPRKSQQLVKRELWNSSDFVTQSGTCASSEDDPLKSSSVTKEVVCERPESPVAEEASSPSAAQNVDKQTPHSHISDKCHSLIKDMSGVVERSLSFSHMTDELEVPPPGQLEQGAVMPQVTPSLEQSASPLATPTVEKVRVAVTSTTMELAQSVTTARLTLKSPPSFVVLQDHQSEVIVATTVAEEKECAFNPVSPSRSDNKWTRCIS